MTVTPRGDVRPAPAGPANRSAGVGYADYRLHRRAVTRSRALI